LAKNFKTGVIITGNADGAVKAVNLTEKQLANLNKTTKRTGKSTKKLKEETSDGALTMASLAKAAAVAGTALAAMGINSVVQDFLDVNTEAERYRGALVTITGDQKLAAQAFGAIEEIASNMPFTLDQSINAFVKMKNLGLDPTEEALTSFGNTAAAMGKDMDQMIEAVADASTMEFERLKEFGIKAKQEGDQVQFTFQGVTTTVAKESGEIVKFLENIGNVAFAGAMEEQMERLPGLFANLEDANDSMFRAFGDAGATFIAADILGVMIADTNEAAGTADTAFEFMVTAVGHFANALGGIEIAYEMVENTTRIAVIGVLQLWKTMVETVTTLFDDFADDVIEFFKPVTDIVNDILNSDASKAIAGTIKNIVGQDNVDMMNAMAGAVGDFTGAVADGVTDVDAMDSAIAILQADFLEGQEDIRKLLEEDLPADQWEAYVETVRTRAADAKAELIPLNDVLDEINSNTNDAGDSSKKFASGLRDVEGGASSATKEFEKLGSSIEKTFADVLKGSFDSFADFFGSLISLAANAAANIAASFAFDFAFGGGGSGGGGGGGGGGSIAGSIGASAGGNAIGSTLGGIGGTALTAKILGDGLFEGATGNILSTFGVGQTPSFAADGSISGSGGGVGFDPMTALQGIGAGIAGSFIGTNLGGAFTDKEANSGIGATVGGAIGSIWGPVGTFLGSALGGFVDTLTGSKPDDPEFSVGTDLNGQPVGQSSFSDGDIQKISESVFGGVRLITQDFALSGEQGTAVFGMLDALASLEDAIGANLTDDQVAAVSGSVSQQALLYRKGDFEFQEFFVERMKIIFDEIGGDIDVAFDQLTAGLSTDEFIGSIEAIAAAAFTIGGLGEELGDTVDELVNFENQSKTLFDVYAELSTAVVDMTSAFDLSAESVQELALGLDQQRQVATSLAVSYHVLGEAVSAALAGTIDSIQESVLSDEELYAKRQQSIAELMAELGGTMDPAKIELLVGQIDQLTRASFGQLDESGQAQNAAGTIDFISQLEALANQQIAAGLQNILDTEAAAAAAALELINLESTQRQTAFDNFLEGLGLTQAEFLARFGETIPNLDAFIDNLGVNQGEFIANVGANVWSGFPGFTMPEITLPNITINTTYVPPANTSGPVTTTTTGGGGKATDNESEIAASL
jgi:hypothetical protein